MLNKLIKLPNLAPELARRIADSDEVVLMRAFKRISNTEIASVLSTLPMEQVNRILVILPHDIANRVVAWGFAGKKASYGTLRKLFNAIDAETKNASMTDNRSASSKPVTVHKRDASEIPTQMGAVADVLPEQKLYEDVPDDRSSAASLFFLDTIGKIVGNSFRKH